MWLVGFVNWFLGEAGPVVLWVFIRDYNKLVALQALCRYSASDLQVGADGVWHLHLTCICLFSPVQRVFRRGVGVVG